MDPKTRRPPPRIETLGTLLEQPLCDESSVLEALLGALGRGHAHPELWSALHAAAQRDDRLAELAFAYESAASDRRFAKLAPGALAEFMSNAAAFFADVFGDPDGAVSYLERLLAAAPTHESALARMEAILDRRGDHARLVDLVTKAAEATSDKPSALALWRKAARLATHAGAGEDAGRGTLGPFAERELRAQREVLRLDADDHEAIDRAIALCERGGRAADAAKLAELRLSGLDADDPAGLALAERVLVIHERAREPEKGISHLERVLAARPESRDARRVAEGLLSHRSVGPRARAALADALLREGDSARAAEHLTVLVEQLRGAKRTEAQKRLAQLKFQALGDLFGAFTLSEQILALEPGDDEVRERYVRLAQALDKVDAAIKLLSRAVSAAKDPHAKARVHLDLGALTAEAGDERRARASFAIALESPEDAVALAAARRLSGTVDDDPRLLAAVLTRIAGSSSDEGERELALVSLARHAEERLRDAALAIATWRRLEPTAREDEALAAQERLYAAGDAPLELARVLARRAEREPDRALAEQLALRAFDLAAKSEPRAKSLATLEALEARFGLTAAIGERLSHLLEAERRFDELERRMAELALTTAEAERPQWVLRRAQLLEKKLDRALDAIAAYASAATLGEPKAAKLALERLTGDARPELALAAASALEPLVRADGSHAGLARVLEVRGAHAATAQERLAALEQASELYLGGPLRDDRRALAIAERGLYLALDVAPERAEAWADRLEAATRSQPAERARALSAALEGRPIETRTLARLARRTGEALVTRGDVERAVGMLRSALAVEPDEPELLARIDDLLREQGAPEARIALYQSLLDGATPERRRELSFSIARIEREALGDRARAAATYRALLADDPGDRAAREGLFEALSDDPPALLAALEQLAPHVADDLPAHLERIARVALDVGALDVAERRLLELFAGDARPSDEALAMGEALGERAGHPDLTRAALLRRVREASEPAEEAAHALALGRLARDQHDDAAGSWLLRAGGAWLVAEQRERAVEAFELALTTSARGEAARALVSLYAESLPERLPSAWLVLLEDEPDAERALELLGSLARAASASRDTTTLEAGVRLAAARLADTPLAVARARSLYARTLASLPEREDDAVRALREALAAPSGDPALDAADLGALVSLLERVREPREREGDRRWLHALRLERATHDERASVLFAWATWEELADERERADELLARLLAESPEHEAALVGRARLSRALGDPDRTLAALAALRELRQGPARAQIELELAEACLAHGRPAEGVAALEAVLDAHLELAGDERLVALGRALLSQGPTAERTARAVERALPHLDASVGRAWLELLLASEAPSLAPLRLGWIERLLTQGGDERETFELALRAVREAPHAVELWERVEALGRGLGETARIAEAYRSIFENLSTWSGSADALDEIGRRAVDFHEEWLDDPDAGVRMLRRIVELETSLGDAIPREATTWAFDRLALLYNGAERWSDLFSLYDLAIAWAGSDELRAQLLSDQVEVARDLAHDPDRAILALTSLVRLRNDARTRASLERLLERYGRHRELMEHLELQLGALRGEALARAHLRIAQLAREGVGDLGAALDHVEAALAEGEAPLALTTEALELARAIVHGSTRKAPELARPSLPPPVSDEELEALFGDGAALAHPPPSLQPSRPSSPSSPPSLGPASAARAPLDEPRVRAAALLERREPAAEPRERARVLDVLLEAELAPAERARLLREAIDLRAEVLSDPHGALEALAELLALEPDVPEHQTRLRAMAFALGAPERLSRALEEAASGAQSTSTRVGLLEQAAVVEQEALGNLERAITLRRSVLPLVASSDDELLRATKALDVLLEKAGRLEELCDALERVAELERDEAAKKKVLADVARIAERDLSDPARAQRALERRLELDPRAAQAQDPLVELLERRVSRGDHERDPSIAERLDALLELRAEHRGDAALSDLLRLAELREHVLGDPERAIAALLRCRARFGRSEETGDALARIYERTGRVDDLLSLLELDAEADASGERKGLLHRRRGLALLAHGRPPGEAARALERAIEAGDEPAVSTLERLVDELARAGHDRAGLSRMLETLEIRYALDGTPERGLRVLEARLAAAGDDDARVALLVELAQLVEERGGPSPTSLALFVRARSLSPDAARTEHLLAHFRALVERGAVADEALGTLAGVILDARAELDDDARSVLRALAHAVAEHVARARADGPIDALSLVERGLELAPLDRELLELRVSLARAGARADLVGSLLALSRARGDDADLAREAAEVARGAGRTSEARAIARDVLGHASRPGALDEPSAAWAIDFLVELALLGEPSADTHREVTELCLEGARVTRDVERSARLRLVAAQHAPPERALALYEELFAERPSDPRVYEPLEGLHVERGSRADVRRMRRRRLELAGKSSEALGLSLSLAELSRLDGELDEANRVLVRAFAEHGTSPEVTEQLASLCLHLGRPSDAVTTWETHAQRLAEAHATDDAARAFVRAAELADEAAGQPERAIGTLRRATSLGSTEALEPLARLLARSGAHRAAADVLERLCARTEGEELAPLVLSLAEQYVEAGDPPTARARLEAALAQGASARTLRPRLIELLRAGDDPAGLAVLLVEEAHDAHDAEPGPGETARRVRSLLEAAALFAGPCGAPERAIPLYDEASRLVPDDLHVELSRERNLALAGRAAEAVAGLRSVLERFGTRRPKERALVHYELGRAYLASGDRPGALAELDLALKVDPGHPESLLSLARLAREEGQIERAHRTYRALLLVVRKPQREGVLPITRAEVLLELSELAELEGEPARGAEYLESAFEVAAQSSTEQERLFASLRARGRTDTLARALEAQLASGEGDALTLSTELGAAYDRLGRLDDAMGAYLRALTLGATGEPVHTAAIDVARRAEQVGRYVRTAELLLERAEPSEVVRLLRRIARALEGIDDRESAKALVRAEEALGASASPSPQVHDEIRRALQATYQRLGDEEAEARVLESRVDVATNEDAAAFYRLAALRLRARATRARGADLLERALSLRAEPEAATSMLREALDDDPHDARVTALLERVAREAGDAGSLAHALALRAEQQASVEGLREAITLGLDAQALESLERTVRSMLARARPDDEWSDGPSLSPVLVRALAELRRRAGDAAEEAELRERAAALGDPGDERDELLRAAELARDALGDPARAARIYEHLRRRDPAAPELYRPLAEAYRALGDVARLGALLDELAALTDEPRARAALRVERARLVAAREPALARALLREALDDDPRAREAAMLLVSMVEEAGDEDELVELLRRQLDVAKEHDDLDAIESLTSRLASIAERRDDHATAIDLYHGLLDWRPDSLPALRALVRLTEVGDVTLDVADALERLLAIEVGDDAADTALRLAELHAARGDDAGTERALELGYRRSGGSPRLRADLAARYSLERRFDKLAELFVLDAERIDPADASRAGERAECLLRAADSLRQLEPAEPARAVSLLERALASAPAHHEALFRYLELAEAEGRASVGIEALDRALAVPSPDAARATLHLRRAALRRALGETALVLEDLEEALALGEASAAAELVDELERALDVRVALGDGDGADALRKRLATLLELASRADEARAHLGEVARRSPKDRDALRALAALETRQGRWDAAVSAYRRLIPLEEPEHLADVALRFADACERADRLADARGGLERALRAAPRDARVRERLRAVLEALSAHGELAQLVLEDAQAASEVSARFELLLKAGRLLCEAEADGDQAVRVLEEARALRPDDEAAVVALAVALERAGRRDDGRALVGAAIAGRGRRTKGAAPLFQALARLELADGNLTEALEAHKRAFESDPQNAGLALELGRFAADLDDHEAASRAFRAVTMMRGVTPTERAEAYHHLAAMAAAQGDARRARVYVDKALADDPEHAAARALAAELKGS